MFAKVSSCRYNHFLEDGYHVHFDSFIVYVGFLIFIKYLTIRRNTFRILQSKNFKIICMSLKFKLKHDNRCKTNQVITMNSAINHENETLDQF